MTGSKDSLGSLGTLLAVLGAIITIILIILQVFSIPIDFIPSSSFLEISTGLALNVGGIDILQLIWAILLLFIGTGKINIGEPLLEGILILILGVLMGGIGGILAILGGIFVILDALF